MFVLLVGYNTSSQNYEIHVPKQVLLENLHVEKEMLIGVSYNKLFDDIPEPQFFDICKISTPYDMFNPIIIDFSEFIKSNNYDSISNYFNFAECLLNDNYKSPDFYTAIFRRALNHNYEYYYCYTSRNDCIVPNQFEFPVSSIVSNFNSNRLRNNLYLFTCKMTYFSYPEEKEYRYFPDFKYNKNVTFDLQKYECYNYVKILFNDFFIGREVSFNHIVGIKDINIITSDSLKIWFMEHPEVKNNMNTESYLFYRDNGYLQ
jgi:hypothetical protein